jgi:hypothetical protein
MSGYNASTEYNLRVYFHVIRRSNGSGGQTLNNVYLSYDILNQDYNELNINFVWNGCVDFIDNDSWFTGPASNPWGIFNINKHTDGIDIYLFDKNANSPGGMANGVGSKAAFWVSGTWSGFGPVAQSHIISHEMGHVLFLWHTHHQVESGGCEEYVDGSNCWTCGDFVCDTPSDPYLGFNVNHDNCQWLGSGYDSHGDPYNPDETLIMAYTWPGCMSTITEQQGERMRGAIATLPYLLNCIIINPSPNDICNCDEDLHIWENTVFDKEDHWSGNIFVHNGAQLTITNNQRYGENKAIKVLKGGKLVVDGAKLTSCTNQWAGIIVQGNPLESQSNTNEHGIVETKNGAIIENAIRGVGNSYSDADNGGIVRCDNTTFKNCEYGLYFKEYKFTNTSYARECTFIDGETGVYLMGNDATHFEKNNFINLQKGIWATNSHFELKQENIFDNISEAGVLANATAPGLSSAMIYDYNQFKNCYYGISLSGNTANKDHTIKNNYFEDCWFAIDLDGDNHYDVNDNRFSDCAYGVISWATGKNYNWVQCNEMIYTGYGNVYMLYDNNYSRFVGNDFLSTGSGPYQFDIKGYDAIVHHEQGSLDWPAMNYFWSTNDIVYEGEPFIYYLPKNPVARTDPQHPGDYVEEDSETSTDRCGDSSAPVPVITDNQIRQLRLNYCYWYYLYKLNPNNSYYKKMFFEVRKQFHIAFYYWSIQNEKNLTWQKTEELLKLMCGKIWLIKLYGLYLYHGEIAKAETVLNELADPRLYEPPVIPDDLSDESRTSFIATQTINLRYLKSNGTYQFTSADLNTLIAEAEKNIPERAYAGSLYTFATGEILPRILPEDTIQPRDSESDVPEREWTFSPNPASDALTIDYNGKSEISGKITVYSTDGRLILAKPIKFNGRSDSDLNVSTFAAGIYMISITDESNAVIYKDKFIKIK